uniref:Uncharacterized protein n=1 Tax=viral metagenome TaxID=1070528 RepID=A0A6M3IY78_9ZZZZ
MYNDEVIQLIGGVNDFIGKLDQSEHPLGDRWFRIKDPCLVFNREDPAHKRMTTVVARLSGPDGKSYRNFVDVYIPLTDPVEIRVLDKDGPLCKVYIEERDRKAPTNIIIPQMSIRAN